MLSLLSMSYLQSAENFNNKMESFTFGQLNDQFRYLGLLERWKFSLKIPFMIAMETFFLTTVKL